MLTASSGKRNVTVWRPSVCPSVISQTRDSVLRRRSDEGQRNIAILDIWNAVSPKRCKVGGKVVLVTNTKSNMSFRLVLNR